MLAPQKKAIEAQTVISMQHTGAHDEIGSVYHELYEWARHYDVAVTGPGLTTFLCPPNKFDPESALFEVCLPVAAGTQGDNKVTVKELPACTVACTEVEGPYDKIPAHYTEMLAWLTAEGWETAGPPREVYIKRPGADGSGDPNAFVTEIQFPIR